MFLSLLDFSQALLCGFVFFSESTILKLFHSCRATNFSFSLGFLAS